jgi:hypothetical protein
MAAVLTRRERERDKGSSRRGRGLVARRRRRCYCIQHQRAGGCSGGEKGLSEERKGGRRMGGRELVVRV